MKVRFAVTSSAYFRLRIENDCQYEVHSVTAPIMGPMADSRGNALHQLQAFVHPHVKHVITQTFRVEDVEDSGDPDRSYIHMWRQAIKVQRGEQMDRITALLLETHDQRRSR